MDLPTFPAPPDPIARPVFPLDFGHQLLPRISPRRRPRLAAVKTQRRRHRRQQQQRPRSACSLGHWLANARIPTHRRQKQQQQQQQRDSWRCCGVVGGVRAAHEAPLPPSAGSLRWRRQTRRRGNHVQPTLVAAAANNAAAAAAHRGDEVEEEEEDCRSSSPSADRRHRRIRHGSETRRQDAMTEGGYAGHREERREEEQQRDRFAAADEEEELQNDRRREREEELEAARLGRVLEDVRHRRSPRAIKEDRMNGRCHTNEASGEQETTTAATTNGPSTIFERLSPIQLIRDEASARQRCAPATATAAMAAAAPLGPAAATTAGPPKNQHHQRSTASQTFDRVVYRLRFFPTLKDIVDEENKPPDSKRSSRLLRYFRFLGRVSMCQFGLAWLLTLWAILGAGAFYVTEGPREREQVVELKDLQRDLAVGLATELRQLRADDRETEPLWSSKVRQYVARHEKLLLIAVSSGYGEGGDNGQLWTFSGCVLFAISVLTTLGFGAPVPRTNAGRAVAVVFAAIGIPAHFLLVLNLGLIFAVKLKRYGIRKKYPNECRDLETTDAMPIPPWVKIMPFFGIGVYYIMGILCFGAARLRPFYSSLLFPLDFTAAGGLSTIAGYVRILYGVYLEGAILLTAIAVAIAKVSATQSLTNIGLKYGLLIPV